MASVPTEYLSQLLRKLRARGPCEITLPDLIKKWGEQGGECFLTGIELRVDDTGDWRPSIGRKDPSLGYTYDNTTLCCLEFNGPCPWSLNDIHRLVYQVHMKEQGKDHFDLETFDEPTT